jgi:hypothetical protein
LEISQASKRKVILSVAIGLLIVLNLITLIEAYPQTTIIDSGCCGDRPLQKDFSAFYTAAWRLFNDPSHIYTVGNVNDGGPQTIPPPEAYKYLPSFLFMVAPFLVLGYQQALVAFDVFQFLLLPLMALLIYALVQKRGTAVTLIVAAIVLILPLPWPHWGLSVPYYWQWAEGQSKVLETFLLLLSFYLGMKRRPKLSGLVFALTAFDPRFTLLSIPLFLLYNRDALKKSGLVAVGFFALSNAVLIYPGVGSGFIAMLLSSGISTPLYYYALIPLVAIASLTVLNAREIGRTFKQISRR